MLKSETAAVAATVATKRKPCANPECGATFADRGNARKFCSDQCRRDHRRRQSLPVQVCANPACGKRYQGHGRRLTCSPECAKARRQTLAIAGRQAAALVPDRKTCPSCGRKSVEIIDDVAWCWRCEM